ncbi:unnamed protein product [Microthlaspi erraticum]|uniref:Uncharacterized protein n=1 Tax=Microthlaspi erraticum TaxID=1685480 RepID=A0A6D2J075_9BRAS|nr:unnamed protein product [Microthlaspi erraticum]
MVGVWIAERIEFAEEMPLQRVKRDREREERERTICGFSKTRGEEEGKVLVNKIMDGVDFTMRKDRRWRIEGLSCVEVSEGLREEGGVATWGYVIGKISAFHRYPNIFMPQIISGERL